MQKYTVNGNNPNQAKQYAKQRERIRKYVIFSLSLFSLLITFILFFVPFCVDEYGRNITPIAALDVEASSLVTWIVFIMVFAMFAASITYFLRSIKSYSGNGAVYARKSQNHIVLNAVFVGLYFLSGFIFSVVMNMLEKNYTTFGGNLACLILVTAIAVVNAVVSRKLLSEDAERTTRTPLALRVEFFLYSLAAAGFTITACLTDIIEVEFSEPFWVDPVKLNGMQLLKTYNSETAGFQLVAFLLVSVITISFVLLVASLISLISGSKLFFKITLGQLFCSGISSLLIGLFGKYYEIVQKINEDTVISWIYSVTDLSGINISYKVKSSSFVWFAAVAVIILIVLIRKPYTKGTMREAVLAVNSTGLSSYDSYGNIPGDSGDLPASSPRSIADPCPAFSELDGKLRSFRQKTEFNEAVAYEAPTLSGLVQFIVTYARDSRLHLSYTASDIAAFIAGLGATRLTILQGMSGTGKTSLPKIFAEAVLGDCEIVEIESSWRDKNELLGYYNEFSRTYTPKKFTQALYKAKLNPERITFIVLDEMNLSRVEYYFSDFLSLMENEEDKREIKLLNVGLYRNINGTRYSYKGLTGGHTIKIPNNIWFVGTANRDESTFEISDKVYDRAHTMNFNKRAPKTVSFGEPIPQRYLSSVEFLRLIDEAKQSVVFDMDTCNLIKEIEELLLPYNISFGNRIANQIEDFVKIYCACFTPSEAVVREAVETIMLSKVVSKLEFKSVDNKRQLASEFERRQLYRCSEFILKLNED